MICLAPLTSRGFGPPVFVGFDCEWEYQAKGRNVLLSVQFYIIGPTGLRYSKVINRVGMDAVQDRPSLAEALYDLLDEAEIECIFDEWPEEVVLCGHFTRADISVFRDFKQFRQQLQAVNGTLATTARPAQVKLPLKDEQAERLKHRYPVKGYDVKNAGRSKLHEHVSPATPEVLAFLDVVKARFPGLETGRFLVRGSAVGVVSEEGAAVAAPTCFPGWAWLAPSNLGLRRTWLAER
jgi:hypothetical protein